jgi:hypothetical protein
MPFTIKIAGTRHEVPAGCTEVPEVSGEPPPWPVSFCETGDLVPRAAQRTVRR